MTARDTQATVSREMSDSLVRTCEKADFKIERGPSTWYQRRDGLPMQGGIA